MEINYINIIEGMLLVEWLKPHLNPSPKEKGLKVLSLRHR
jgi:hypothetical protein